MSPTDGDDHGAAASSSDYDRGHPISTGEAYHLLQPLQSRFRDARSEATKVFQDALSYVETTSKIKERGLLDDLRCALVELGFSAEETAQTLSLLPQTSDEAKILIPSITRLDEGIIEAAVAKILKMC